MKPIIMDMKDLSDSTEMYEEKPNRFMIYTIYLILTIFIAGLIWTAVSEMELVVKSNGMFRGEEPLYEVSSGITGEISTCNVKDGQNVQEGDTLFIVESELLGETIKSYETELSDINQRLEILKAYEECLEEGSNLPITLQGNTYYEEFADRQKLLYTNMDLDNENTQGQKETYQGNVDTILDSIQQYKTKKDKLTQAKSCIRSRQNTFAEADSYYSSIVTSYLSNYNLTASQYDTKIKQYEKQKEEYDNLLEEAKTISDNAMSKGEIKEARKEVKSQIDTLEKEKEQTLSNLELQQIQSIEQMISAADETILSLESNLTTANLQLDSLESIDSTAKKESRILTEKGNVAAEILSYQSKAKECEEYLKNYDEKNNRCKITANASGCFYLQSDIKQGTYVQEGSPIGKIYPTETEGYYAEVYVENKDVAKLKEGQQVNFEIAAYPSSEYGYFTGKIASISKDITINEGNGSAYYLVKVSCDNLTVQNKDGETGTLKNGMACQAKIVTGEETVLKYIFKKLEFLG